MSRGKEVLVGVVIVVAIAVAVVGTLWLQDALWTRQTRSLHVLARDVGQLMDGNDVKLRGVTIGQVSSIAVEPSGEAVRVVLRIDREVTLPDTAVAVLAPESMFGDWQVEIAPRSRFPNFEFMDVEEADTVIAGYALPDISRLTATAEEISKDLATITDRIEVAFTEETANNIARTIDNIEGVSRRLAELVENQSTALETMGDDILSAVEAIELAAGSARSTMEQVDSLLARSQADSILADTRAIAQNLRVLSEKLEGSSDDMTRTLARADSAFTRINAIAARVESGQGTLGRLVNDTTFLSTADEALSELALLMRDLRENPRRYINLSIF